MGKTTPSRIRAGEAFVRITADNSALIHGLDTAKQALRSFGQTLKGLGADMMQLSGAIALPLSFSAKAFADFDDKVRILKAITGATVGETSTLTSYMRELGATTAFTAEQVAQGAVELSRMGFNVTEVKDGLRPIMDLVRATGTETFRLGEIASYASATMRGFGLSSENFADVCDIMGVAADNSAMDIADLGEAMKIVAPSAKTINEDIKDTAASLMLMANAGIRGSLAGTSLRKVYQSLAAQSGKIKGLSQEQIEEGIRGAEELSGMGISLVDKSGNLRKTNDIMADIAKKARALKTGEKINFATDIFDLRGSLGALSLMDNAASLDEFRARLDNSRGFTRKVAEDMEQGIGGAIRLIVSQFKEMQITIGEALWKTFGKKLRNGIVSVIRSFRNLISENKKLASQFVVGVGAVFGFGVALFGLGAALKIVASGIGLVSFLLKAMVGAVLLPINAYIALKNVILGTLAAMKAFGLFLGAEASIAAFAGSMMTLTGIFLGFVAAWKLLPPVVNAVISHFKTLVPIATDAFKTIRDSLMNGDMQGAAKVFMTSLRLAFAMGVKPIRQIWISLRYMLVSVWTDTIYDIRLGWSKFSSWIFEKVTEVVFAILEKFDSLVAPIVKAINKIRYEVSTWLNDVVASFKKVVVQAKDLIANNAFVNSMLKVFNRIRFEVSTWANDIVAFFKKVVTEAKNLFSNDDISVEISAIEEEKRRRDDRAFSEYQRKNAELEEKPVDVSVEISAIDAEKKQKDDSAFTEYLRRNGQLEKNSNELRVAHEKSLNALREENRNTIASLRGEHDRLIRGIKDAEMDEFNALNNQIDALKQAADDAKAFAAQWGVMQKRASDLIKYFNDITDNYRVDPEMQRIVDLYNQGNIKAFSASRSVSDHEIESWGKRKSKSKNVGWRGVIPIGQDRVMTEVSVDAKIDGKNMRIPLIVPDSTFEDLETIAKIANKELLDIPDNLLEKAIRFAEKRIEEGKSVFFDGDFNDEKIRVVNETGDLEFELSHAIDVERNRARYLEERFNTQLEEAKSDRVISPEEYSSLQNLAEERARALALRAEYEKKLNDSIESTSIAIAENSKNIGIGAWSSDALNAIINNSEQKRTAEATESSAQTLLDIRRKMFSGTFGRLTFGS